ASWPASSAVLGHVVLLREAADPAAAAAPEQAPRVNPPSAPCACGRCGGYSGGGRLAFSNVTITDVVGGIWAPGGKFWSEARRSNKSGGNRCSRMIRVPCASASASLKL